MEESTKYCASAWISHLQTRNKPLESASILMQIKEPVKESTELENFN